MTPASIAQKELRNRFGTEGKARLVRSSTRLKKKKPIGKWTSIGWSGCRTGLPWRKFFTMAISFRWKICAAGLGDFAPFLFRHPGDANAVSVSHHSAEIRGPDQQGRADGRKQKLRPVDDSRF